MTLTNLPEHLRPMVEKAAIQLWRIATDSGLHPDVWETDKYPMHLNDKDVEIPSDYGDTPDVRRGRNFYRKTASDSILAFLNACLDGGVALKVTGHSVGNRWIQDDPGIFLNLGEAK